MHGMKGGAAAMALLVLVGTTSSARGDTFGGQLHAVHARGSLQGETIERGGDETGLPTSLELETDAELVGADFRFDWMLGNLRLGTALMVFGVRDLKLSSPTHAGKALTVDDGFGGSLEGFAGVELMKGPVYLYGDLRVVLQTFEAPITLHSLQDDVLKADYGRSSAGVGPRLGMLVPVGHSLMIDLAVYQGLIGGLEQTTAFVGMGYWENDRDDGFTQRLKRSFGGDF